MLSLTDDANMDKINANLQDAVLALIILSERLLIKKLGTFRFQATNKIIKKL